MPIITKITTLWAVRYIWSHDRELNPRPHPYHGCALPTELSRLMLVIISLNLLIRKLLIYISV